jgi:hypothetical protein
MITPSEKPYWCACGRVETSSCSCLPQGLENMKIERFVWCWVVTIYFKWGLINIDLDPLCFMAGVRIDHRMIAVQMPFVRISWDWDR